MSQPTYENASEELGALTRAYELTLTRQLGELDALLARLSEGQDSSVLAAAERLAHRVAGTAGTFGFSQASALAQDIESALDTGGAGLSGEKLTAYSERLRTLCETLGHEPSG